MVTDHQLNTLRDAVWASPYFLKKFIEQVAIVGTKPEWMKGEDTPLSPETMFSLLVADKGSGSPGREQAIIVMRQRTLRHCWEKLGWRARRPGHPFGTVKVVGSNPYFKY